MNNTVNPEKLRKAKIASCCFMGLGQILFLKQYIRGALYALVEIAMICAIVIGTKNIIPGNRKEASYFENTRPEYSEMVKYFSSDDAKDYKSDSDAILEKGASAFKNIIASNEGFLREHGVYVFEDEIDEDAVKAGLREYIKNNSESLKAHGVYLSDELAVLLEEKGESLSDYIDEYELDSDVLDELKEKYAEDADFAALIDNLQEKIDDSIFVAQIDVESDYETAIENICEVIDVNNGYLVAADGESEVALTAYADALAANVPQVIEVDSTDIESLDVTMNNLACLPGQNEDEFESRRESIIDELDENSRKTSKRLAKLMAKVGIKKYADHKDEYETKFKSYENSIYSVRSAAISKVNGLNDEIKALEGKKTNMESYHNMVTWYENAISLLEPVKSENFDGTEKKSAIETAEEIKAKYEDCLADLETLKKIAQSEESSIADVRQAESDAQAKVSEINVLFVAYSNACAEIDARNQERSYSKKSFENSGDAVSESAKLDEKIASLENSYLEGISDKNDADELKACLEQIKKNQVALKASVESFQKAESDASLKSALEKDFEQLDVDCRILELKSDFAKLKAEKAFNDQLDVDIENKNKEIDSVKDVARSVIALYKVDYKADKSSFDSYVADVASSLDGIQDVFNSQVADGIDDKMKDTTDDVYLFFNVSKDEVAKSVVSNCKPTNPNAFDHNYDGCITCKMSNDKGIRTTKHMAWGHGPIVASLEGLFSLGDKTDIYPDTPDTPPKYRDHSIFMMINGIFALIFIGFFAILYAMNIGSANASAEKIIKNGRFPTWQESKNDVSQNSFATIGISPSIIMICVFSIIPLLFSAFIAFTNYSSPSHLPPNNLVEWVGLESFQQMFSSTGVGGGSNAWATSFGWAAIWTIVWAVFATFTCFFVGFFYAFVLQDKRIIIPTFFRTVFILPYAIPTMLSLFVWANLFNGTIGPINEMFKMIGLPTVKWLSDPWIAKGTLIFVNIWIGFPYSMILTTSSMTAISNSLYEAAVIDGATKWQQFKNITYPLVMFQLKPTLIMQFAGNINNFGAVYFLTGGGPNLPGVGLTSETSCGATDILISWIYKLTMNTMKYNLASVLSLLVFVVLVPFALYNFTRTKSFKEGAV